MKMVFGKIKIVFAVYLISVLILFPKYSFGAPGKRTYIGKNIEEKKFISQEEPLPVESEENQIAETPHLELTHAEQFIAEKTSTINEINENITTTRISAKTNQDVSIETNETNKQDSKIETVQPQIISDAHIPLKWEYKMKE